MISQGLGIIGGLIASGFGAYYTALIEEIRQELRRPASQIRIDIIISLLNQLQMAIMTHIASKKELERAVLSYQEPLDALKVRLEDIELQVASLQISN